MDIFILYTVKRITVFALFVFSSATLIINFLQNYSNTLEDYQRNFIFLLT